MSNKTETINKNTDYSENETKVNTEKSPAMTLEQATEEAVQRIIHGIDFNRRLKQKIDNIIKLRTDEEIKTLFREIERQNFKTIEILGIFTAILAFVNINLNLINSSNSFLAIMITILGFTAALSTLIFLIHYLFSYNKKMSLWIWAPILIIFILFIIALIWYCQYGISGTYFMRIFK